MYVFTMEGVAAPAYVKGLVVTKGIVVVSVASSIHTWNVVFFYASTTPTHRHIHTHARTHPHTHIHTYTYTHMNCRRLGTETNYILYLVNVK